MDSRKISSLALHSTTTDAMKHVEMSVKNDAGAVVNTSAFLHANVLEKTQSYDG